MTEKQQKNLTFLTFSAYRIVLYCGFLCIILFAHLFGPMMWRHYIGIGNAFSYQSGTLAVHYLDVGNGDAIIIQLPDSRIIMIDSGTDLYYSRVKTYLKTRILTNGNKNIDFLIATHSHDDHVGGLPQLLDDFNVDTVYRPHNKSNSHFDTEVYPGNAHAPLADTTAYTDFITAAYTHAKHVEFIKAGIEITDAAGSFLMYFHTPTLTFADSLSSEIPSDFNDISPIISLRYKNNFFLFTGDAGLKTENQFRDCHRANDFVNGAGFQNLEVYLKVGHHGSRYSTTVSLLEFIKPNKAIISVGAHNINGHPHNLLIKRLKNVAGLHEQDILETRTSGNITLATDGATERMFLAFDNEVDLTMVYVISAAALFFVCFTNFHVVKY